MQEPDYLVLPPVQSIDEGIEVLTDVAAATRNTADKFPTQSINVLVEEKLMHFAARQRQTIAAGIRHDSSLATEAQAMVHQSDMWPS